MTHSLKTKPINKKESKRNLLVIKLEVKEYYLRESLTSASPRWTCLFTDIFLLFRVMKGFIVYFWSTLFFWQSAYIMASISFSPVSIDWNFGNPSPVKVWLWLFFYQLWLSEWYDSHFKRPYTQKYYFILVNKSFKSHTLGNLLCWDDF